MSGGIALVTLCLNEMEWLPLLWQQHKDWPDLCAWVFVEAADPEYARANPEMVTREGLSVDGTTRFLEEIWYSDEESRIALIAHGFSSGPSAERGKCAARQRYFDVLEDVRPEFVIMLDADEFYTREDQRKVNGYLRTMPKACASAVFRKREIWRPPSIAHERVPRLEAVGGFWKMPCCHWWRWESGMHHRDCHNTPTLPSGEPVNRSAKWFDRDPDAPQMMHMGFASQARTRLAKNKYYADRGESADPLRSWHVQARAEWETWTPDKMGKVLLKNGRIVPYVGSVPECFAVNAEEPKPCA